MRPRDLEYAQPEAELLRLSRRGVVQRMAHGYYLVPPETHRRHREWRPSIEAVALGVAVADYGCDDVALMGPSAARLRGVPPRALGVAVVAVSKSYRGALETSLGRVQFVSRTLDRVDRVRATTEVVEGWRTSDEQTLLDVADRPTLGAVTVETAGEIITALAADCDWELVAELASRQRKRAGFVRASWLAAAVVDLPVPDPPRRPVPSLGLRPKAHVDPAPFGIKR